MANYGISFRSSVFSWTRSVIPTPELNSHLTIALGPIPFALASERYEMTYNHRECNEGLTFAC